MAKIQKNKPSALNIVPSFKKFCELARQGNLIPVWAEVLADLETPVSSFLKIDEGDFGVFSDGPDDRGGILVPATTAGQASSSSHDPVLGQGQKPFIPCGPKDCGLNSFS